MSGSNKPISGSTSSTKVDAGGSKAWFEATHWIRHNLEFDATDDNSHPDLYQELKHQWVMALGSRNKTVDEWFDLLYRQHNEPGRHYHTAVHLKEMLDYVTFLETNGQLHYTIPSPKVTLRLATFFHDAVYNAASSTNEQDSANLFQEFCKDMSRQSSTRDDAASSVLNGGSVQTIVNTLILATEKHQVLTAEDADTTLQSYFLDIDMAVLGKDRDAYLAYAALVRKEYLHVPRKTYCDKRAEILESFCAKDRLFLSDTFHRMIGSAAKDNLRAEIESLRKGIIPGDE